MDQAFGTFVEWYAAYGYPVLFFGVLLENAGIPVPGETAVLVAGFVASPAGGARLDLGLVIGLTCLAAILGDNLGYWLGRCLARPRLQRGRRFLLLTPRTLDRMERYFARYGLLTVLVARFIAGLRVVAALAAGTAGMPWPGFFLANAAGAAAWASAIGLLGYFFGQSWQALHRWLGWGLWLLLACVLLLAGGWHLYLRRTQRARPNS